MNNDSGVNVNKKGIDYWLKEEKEWRNFLRECRDELTSEEIMQVLGRIRVISDIVWKYQFPVDKYEKQKIEKMERAFARQTLLYGK